MDGEPVPLQLAGYETLEELRFRVADALGAPSLHNVELLDEACERLHFNGRIADLGDMKIQTFVFGLPEPSEEERREEDFWAPPPVEDLSDGYKEDHTDLNTTRASSEAVSPSAVFPLHEAVSLGDCNTVEQLLADGHDIGMLDAEGETALHRAAYHTRKDLVVMLLGARADPNALDRKAKTPLRKAYDSKEVAEVLLAAGADTNLADKNGNTALHRAAEDDHTDVAELLLANSADPNLLSDDDLSALHTAAIFGKAGVSALLLGARADVNAKGADGNTALHFASYGAHEEVGKLLLQAGADPKVRNEDGETPLEHACNAEHEAPAWLSTSA